MTPSSFETRTNGPRWARKNQAPWTETKDYLSTFISLFMMSEVYLSKQQRRTIFSFLVWTNQRPIFCHSNRADGAYQ